MVIEPQRHGRVEFLRINRPEARNAVNDEVSKEMEAALDVAEEDDDVSVVVITGTDGIFSAGADLKMIAQGRGAELGTIRGGFAGLTTREFPKPLIAAVNGPALAGGFEVALACDMVVAADTARFGIPEVQRGLFAAAGALIRLPKRIATALAMELALTGEPISAQRALDVGLVNRVVPQDQVLECALALAQRISDNGPVAVRKTLKMLREAPDLTEPAAWVRNYELAVEVFATDDATEGAVAFAEKRAPRWSGH